MSSQAFIFSINFQDSYGLFECILVQFEPMVKNSTTINFDNFKVTRFNRTTFVFNGTVQNFLDDLDDIDVSSNYL